MPASGATRGEGCPDLVGGEAGVHENSVGLGDSSCGGKRLGCGSRDLSHRKVKTCCELSLQFDLILSCIVFTLPC